ncbi:hypothetical protein [Stella sp.]|uniref:hypothetical protein n=1 Tax=Stella sp. TaxID=2912054 RepID=UPI0035B3636B
MAFSAGLLGTMLAAAPASAYQVCLFSTAISTHYFVWVGPLVLTMTDAYHRPCREVRGGGAIQAGLYPESPRDCGYQVPADNTTSLEVVISRTDPGIPGFQPIITCTVTPRS